MVGLTCRKTAIGLGGVVCYKKIAKFVESQYIEYTGFLVEE